MKIFSKSIAVTFLFFFSVNFIQAQDRIQPIKFKRNAIKIGTSLTIAILFVGYEYAITKHVGIGILGSVNGGLFSGYTGNLTARYYFGKYSGFFIEARGGYSYFNPIVYSGYHRGTSPNNDNRYYDEEHEATISYWSGGISGGYRVTCSKRFFFDFLIGVHTGQASFGSKDTYIGRSPIALQIGSDDVKTVFENSGPGMPLHLMINVGFTF